jgi:uncharacterized membrane protein
MTQIREHFRHFLLSPQKVFITLALLFGVTSAFLMPQLAVNDEGAHFQRAYELATGQVKGKGCDFPKEVMQSVLSGDNISTIGQSKNYSNDYNKPVDFNSSNISTNHTCGSASSYSPIMHFPQAIGVFIAKISHPSLGFMILCGRIVNILFYAIALYWIIKFVRIGKWTFVVVGLLPVLIHLAGSLSADVMNTVIVLGFIASMLNVFSSNKPLTKKQILPLFCFGVLLPLTKLPNLFIAAPLIFLSPKLFPQNPTRFKWLHFNIFKYATALTMLAVAGGLLLLWHHIYNGDLITTAPANPLVERPWHFVRILFNTYIDTNIGYGDVVFRGITGIFSFKYGFPSSMILLSWCLILFTLLANNTTENNLTKNVIGKLSLATLLTVAAIIMIVTYGLYTAWAIQPYRFGPGAIYADGVQGRYFTALIPLLIPTGIYLRRYVSVRISREEIIGGIVLTTCFIQLLYYTIQTYGFAIA